ncbi:DUF4260 domain-containing protein [Vagococcus fluvialis]|uniref:DUF4260 domain-containing protein n=1 Tax=Vagococcus fluvialis TaxID=2738 RepID=UPI0037B4DDD0
MINLRVISSLSSYISDSSVRFDKEPRLLKIENLLLFMLTLFIYFYLFKFSLWYFLILLFIPDVSMIGYFINTKVGAYIYNTIHYLFFPITLLFISILVKSNTATMIALIWISHIFMDRSLGFGLKYLDDFKHTHLS